MCYTREAAHLTEPGAADDRTGRRPLTLEGLDPTISATGVAKVRRLAFIALAAGVAACGTLPPTPQPSATPSPVGINVVNGTTVAVAIAVNGTVVETIPPGATETPLRAVLPARPWSVEARSPTGRVLAAFTVPKGDAVSAQSSVGAAEDLACGTLDLWAGGPRGDHPMPVGPTRAPCE